MAKPQRPPGTASGTAPGSPTSVGSSRRGRPRLTPADLRERVVAYCKRFGAQLNDEGLPPFPAGKRETEQHRQWMALYKAQRRVTGREPEPADLVARRQELLTAQRGRCPVCHKPLDPGESRLDCREADPAVLHEPCLQLVELGRALGPEALERAKQRL